MERGPGAPARPHPLRGKAAALAWLRPRPRHAPGRAGDGAPRADLPQCGAGDELRAFPPDGDRAREGRGANEPGRRAVGPPLLEVVLLRSRELDGGSLQDYPRATAPA